MRFKRIFFVIVALGFFYWGWTAHSKSKATSSWQSTDGQVVSVTITPYTSKTGTGTGSRSTQQYAVEPVVRYSVDNKTYESREVRFHAVASFTKLEEAEKFKNRFREGSVVPVYYNPGDPTQSVLIPGTTAEGFILIVIGCIALLCCLLTFLPDSKPSGKVPLNHD